MSPSFSFIVPECLTRNSPRTTDYLCIMKGRGAEQPKIHVVAGPLSPFLYLLQKMKPRRRESGSKIVPEKK